MTDLVHPPGSDDPQATSPMAALVALARSGLDAESLGRMLAMHERILSRDARIAYHDAMARFRAACPPVPRTHDGSIRRDGATEVRIRYAPRHVIAEHIRPYLAECGLSYRYETEIDDQLLTVTCVVTHVDGHEERASFRCRAQDAAPPRATGVQIAGSAMEYGMRYSLIAALGLSTGPDPDAGEEPAVERITASQAADLAALADEVGVDVPRYLAALGVTEYGDLPASEYARAVDLLERRRRQRGMGR